MFKTRPDIVVPLQQYLNIEDRNAVQELHAFHVPVFQKVPRPSFPGMQTLRELLAQNMRARCRSKETDIADSSFIDELERSGFIDRLYARAAESLGYSITSSARESNDGGTVRPSALAVLRLITSSYLVGACTGRSAGFSTRTRV